MIPQELIKLVEEYDKTFDSDLPTFRLFRGRSVERSIVIIKDCLRKKKDVYELGYLDPPENGVLY